MKICIHRGSHQIGGSCVELLHGDARLLVDFGLPLDAGENRADYLPAISGLDGSDPSLLGVLVSHPHLDHFGLLPYISPRIPVGMGKAARKILQAAAPFLHAKFKVPSVGWDFVSEQPLQIGPFLITPYLADHSAYDSYSLLIEAGGKRLFYSGDFRAHGRKSSLFRRFLEHPLPGIDLMLLEGSSFGRIGNDARFATECDLEQLFVETFMKTAGLALVHCSSQNIDRLVSVFRASKTTGRRLVIDLYTAEILRATDNKNIPQSCWPEVALFIPHKQRVHIRENALFDLKDRHSKNRIYKEALMAEPDKFTLLFRPLHADDLQKNPVLMQNACYIYSQWNGYWETGSFTKVAAMLQQHGISKTNIHTSGHASPTDLKAFVESMQPRKVVPIHSFNPEKYAELFPCVEPHPDGHWWEI